MEINPFEARLRMLQLQDGVQMQREATPDEDTAGCPGCPYFWTCDVPHKAENVEAPAEYDREEVSEQVPGRAEYTPRGVEDIGWTDRWIEVDEPSAGEGHRAGIGELDATTAADAPLTAKERRAHRRAEADAAARDAAAPRRSWRERLRPRR
ncbi:hypothetical protein [Brachybacterium hainanense]|uniref:PD-(D/E)XK endonuclease-like domain-containing protein n=1 Tax=Brachybacterium hainanense TaxID=1541174 RepID=A0ABV6RGG9_9MICO